MTAEPSLIKQTHQFSYTFCRLAGSDFLPASLWFQSTLQGTSRGFHQALNRVLVIGLMRKVWKKGVRFEWMPPCASSIASCHVTVF